MSVCLSGSMRLTHVLCPCATQARVRFLVVSSGKLLSLVNGTSAKVNADWQLKCEHTRMRNQEEARTGKSRTNLRKQPQRHKRCLLKAFIFTPGVIHSYKVWYMRPGVFRANERFVMTDFPAQAWVRGYGILCCLLLSFEVSGCCKTMWEALSTRSDTSVMRKYS